MQNRSCALVVAGRYRVVRTLGTGAQAAVFLVEDLEEGRWLSLKVPLRTDSARCERFLHEASLLSRLRHPNVLRLEGRLELGGAPATLTELAHGGSLATWMRRNGPLPPSIAITVALQCADALLHAHAAGVLHRDVKPGNVLVRADGSVALADFGVARSLDDLTEEPGRVCGSPSFMAPEQWTGDPLPDETVDIYGLGATLHRLWTGRRTTELFRAAACPELLDGLPAPVARLIERCCRFRPGERPPLSEVREQLCALLAWVPPGPDPRTTLYDRAPSLSAPEGEPDPELERLRRRVVDHPGAGPETADARPVPSRVTAGAAAVMRVTVILLAALAALGR